MSQLTLLKVDDVIERLQISRSVIYRMIEDGQLPCVHIGRSVRFRSDDIDAFIEKLGSK